MTITHSTYHTQCKHKSIVTLRQTPPRSPSLNTSPIPSPSITTSKVTEPFPPFNPNIDTPPLTPTTPTFTFQPRLPTESHRTFAIHRDDSYCPKCVYEERLLEVKENTLSDIMVADMHPSSPASSYSTSSSAVGIIENTENFYEWSERMIAEHMVYFFIAVMVGLGFGGMWMGGTIWCGVRLVVKTLLFGYIVLWVLQKGAMWVMSTRRERDWWLWT